MEFMIFKIIKRTILRPVYKLERTVCTIILLIIIAGLLAFSLSGCSPKENNVQNVTTEIEYTEDYTTQVQTTEAPEPDYTDNIEDFNEDTVTSTITDSDTSQPLLDVHNWAGEPYVEVNDNVPFFVNDYYLNGDVEFEECQILSELDELGRCGEAHAIIGIDMFPTEPRGEIGNVKPSGWKTSNYNEYPGLIDGNYLYNRCHLIAFMLTGLNSEPRALITGTRYLNVEGMLPFEDSVHDYIIDHPDNHVEYKVTPIFTGDNLVADGVLMEAWSLEDIGVLHFCVFCYNVQPYVEIDYATGDNHISDSYILTENQETETKEENTEASSQTESVELPANSDATYIINTNSMKFHLPTCSSVSDMKESNKKETTKTKEELINEGYSPCKMCIGE